MVHCISHGPLHTHNRLEGVIFISKMAAIYLFVIIIIIVIGLLHYSM